MRVHLSAEFIWHLFLYNAVGRHLPASTYPGGRLWRAIRYWMCRPLFADCGNDVNVEHGASIGFDRSVSIGSGSGIGINARIGEGTRIGSNVMMGPEVLVFTRNHSTSRTDIPMIEQGFEPVLPVIIGDDVWIGARAIILPGINIGSGCVLGAGTVVSRDVPARAIIVGNPGRVVRYRDSLPGLVQGAQH